MAHRVKVCSKYSHVRGQFPALVTLSDAQATLPWLPRIAEACAFRAACRARPPLSYVRSAETDLVCVYTDGSAIYPKVPQVTDCAFAVVRRSTLAPDVLRRAVHSARLSGNAPNAFELVGTGKLQGRQSINRAELAACVIAIGTFQNISLVCDSAFALGVLNKLLDGVPAHKWANLPNYDLVLLLAEAIRHGPQPRTIITKKIKSHCAFDPLLSDDELLDFFGNQQADVAAGAALAIDVDWVRRQRDVAHARIQAVRDRFLSIFSGIGALHATKENDPPSQPQEELAVSVCFSAPVDYLSLDIPEVQGWQFACVWGVTYCQAILDWLRTLRWPPAPQHDRSILWIELLTSFRLASGLRVPVANVECPGTFLLPEINPLLGGNLPSLGEETRMFQHSIRSLETLLQIPLMPWDAWVRQDAYRVLGVSGVGAQGFRVRPFLPNQQEVTVALAEYGRDTSRNMHHSIDLPVRCTFISPFDALVPPASRLKSFRKVKASKAKGPRDTCLPYAVPK